MGMLQDELVEVKKFCEHIISGSKLVSCVESMVRVEIRKTKFKTVIVCVQFPSNYPTVPLLFELKSKTLSDKLLTGLTTVCEQEIKKTLGKPQILKLLSFIKNFINENPLCCCYNEINNVKKLLTSERDELKLRQKSASIHLKVVNNSYYLRAKLLVPDVYPDVCVRLGALQSGCSCLYPKTCVCVFFSVEDIETNFPPFFYRHMLAQSKEYGRQCVEAPLRKLKPNEPKFTPKPSLEIVASFLTDCIKRFPNEICQFCQEQCFACNPNDVVTDEYDAKHVERLYCGHLFHNECLIKYMRKPPFGDKRCTLCNQKIYHDKWVLSDKLAEDRWAHAQARERELAEVTDFFE